MTDSTAIEKGSGSSSTRLLTKVGELRGPSTEGEGGTGDQRIILCERTGQPWP